MSYILEKRREIKEVKYSPKQRGNKDITFIKTNSKQRRTVNRGVTFRKHDWEIREVILTKTKGM